MESFTDEEIKRPKCGPYEFENVNERVMGKILDVLRSSGSEVVGNNPYLLDTNKSGIILHGSWKDEEQKLYISVLRKAFYVSCRKINSVLKKSINDARELAASDV